MRVTRAAEKPLVLTAGGCSEVAEGSWVARAWSIMMRT
jgi:hypothetical protein